VGLFTVGEPYISPNGGLTRGQSGLFKGGGFHLLGVQCLAVISVSLWSGITTWMLLATIDKVIPIRMCIEEEILGADLWIHNIRHEYYDFDAIIAEMRREGMDLEEHIQPHKAQKTSLDFNLFIIDKFLTKRRGNHWIKKLVHKDSIDNFDKSDQKVDLNKFAVKSAWITPSDTLTRDINPIKRY
jgi:hypothetical protein